MQVSGKQVEQFEEILGCIFGEALAIGLEALSIYYLSKMFLHEIGYWQAIGCAFSFTILSNRCVRRIWEQKALQEAGK